MEIYIDDVFLLLKQTTGSSIKYRSLIAQHALALTVPKQMTAKSVYEFAKKTVEQKKKENVFNDFGDGGFIWLFGQKVPVMTYKGTKDSVTEHMGIVYLERKTEEMTYSFRSAIYRFYVRKLTEKIKERMPVLQNYVGLHCSSWSIASVYSTWGKCNWETKKITFSAELATQPVPFIDQVIIHELGHLLYHDHGKGFHDFMAKYVPDHKEIMKRINR